MKSRPDQSIPDPRFPPEFSSLSVTPTSSCLSSVQPQLQQQIFTTTTTSDEAGSRKRWCDSHSPLPPPIRAQTRESPMVEPWLEFTLRLVEAPQVPVVRRGLCWDHQDEIRARIPSVRNEPDVLRAHSLAPVMTSLSPALCQLSCYKDKLCMKNFLERLRTPPPPSLPIHSQAGCHH